LISENKNLKISIEKRVIELDSLKTEHQNLYDKLEKKIEDSFIIIREKDCE